MTPRILTREVLEAGRVSGLSQSDVAKAVGCTSSAVSAACKRFGIVLQHKKGWRWAKGPGSRELRMRALYRNGQTLEQIGRIYGITRERVRQILAKHFGFDATSGGRHAAAERAREQRQATKDAACLAKHGCTHAEYVAIRDISKGEPGSQYRRPTRAFASQRQNAKTRGIDWKLTLKQWWAVWQASGKWGERGRGQGYVMCRHGDQGPYAIGNVFIATARENSSERKGKKSGLPIGVTRRGATFVAHRSFNGKRLHLGGFPTPELAHAAYLVAVAETSPAERAA